MVMTGAGVGALAFRKDMAGATLQIASPTVPPLPPTHRKTLGNGFGDRLSADNLYVRLTILGTIRYFVYLVKWFSLAL